MRFPLRRLLPLLLFCAFCAASWAQPEPGYRQAWKHYQFALKLSAGGHFVAGGDLDGRSTMRVESEDTTEVRGKFLLAEPGAGFRFGGGLGVRMDDNRLSFGFDWTRSEMEHRLLAETATADRWQFGIDYRRDFLSPGEWRPEAGGGVHFSFRDVDGSFLCDGGAVRSARLSGIGLRLSGGVGRWWGERFALIAELEYELDDNRNVGVEGDGGVEKGDHVLEHALVPKIEAWAMF